MEKTNIRAKFGIYGDSFEPDEITRILEIQPSKISRKGDKSSYGDFVIKKPCWLLKTECEESLDINNQLAEILDKLKTKTEQLSKIKEEYSVDFMFSIVIKIENNQSPAIYLDEKTIEFANEIKAGFDFDLYVYS